MSYDLPPGVTQAMVDRAIRGIQGDEPDDDGAAFEEQMATTMEALVAKQWDTAAVVTELALNRVKAGTSTGEEALEFLATEFRKLART